MSMGARIDAEIGTPGGLEALFRAAMEAGEVEEFVAEIVRRHALSPDDVLIAAWFHRLEPRPALPMVPGTAAPATAATSAGGVRRAQWGLAFALSGVLCVFAIALSSSRQVMVELGFAWAPAAAGLLLIFLTIGRSETLMRPGASALRALLGRPLVAIAMLSALTLVAIRRADDLEHLTNVDLLTLIHLPALAWLALGWAVLGADAAPEEVFAAVRKSIEALITAGLFAAAGGAMTLMTGEMFRAIGVELPHWVWRWLASGGPALIPVLAVATVYDPDRAPSAQRSEHGFARVIFTTGRLFLPLTLLVLAIYLVVIPFRFMEPFRSREVLITYNAMLFAVIGLLVAATPLRESEVEGRAGSWVRRGIVAVAACTLLVSLYAMAAVVYRTAAGGLTVNRLTVIGWNTVNIATLALLLYRQSRGGPAAWIESAHRAFRVGLIGYAAWTLFVLIGTPLLRLGGR
jgi:hypothetical protein